MPIYGLKISPLGQISYHTTDHPLQTGDGVLIETEQGVIFAQITSGPLETLPGSRTQEIGIGFDPSQIQDEAGQTAPYILTADDALGSETSRGQRNRESALLHPNDADDRPQRQLQTASPLPPVLRQATPEDWEKERQNKDLARKAAAFCRNCIAERGLDMKLIDVEVFFDQSKMVFYFTAPSRIDFRDLVKELVQEYRTRIELRQIGVRHETQMVGAVGNCGMVCCCRRYLRKFASVTIRMAKEQNLFLNPAKISGICGRLLCCLAYEQDNYDHFHKACPRLGKKYQTSQGCMKILRASMFRNSLIALTEANEEKEFSLDDWQALSPQRVENQKNSPQGDNPSPAPKENSLLVFSAAPDTLDSLEFSEELFNTEDDLNSEVTRKSALPSISPLLPATGHEQTAGKQPHRRKRKRPHRRPS